MGEWVIGSHSLERGAEFRLLDVRYRGEIHLHVLLPRGYRPRDGGACLLRDLLVEVRAVHLRHGPSAVQEWDEAMDAVAVVGGQLRE